MAILKGFKKKFKVKEEEIIDIEQMQKIEDNNCNKTILIEEKPEINDTKNAQVIETNDNISLDNIINIKNNMKAIFHEYWLCKIFSRVALSEDDFKMQTVELDRQLESINENIHDIERSISFYSKIEKLDNEDSLKEKNRIIKRIEKTLLNEKMIKQRLIDINNLYYTHLKMTTVSVCINKNNEQLENFFNHINNIVIKYKNMSDAAYDLYYSSGDFIVSFIKELVEDVKLTNNNDYINKYEYSYFLSSDVVITLDVNEWITLYNKVKFVYKLLLNIEIDAYLRLKEKYTYFEVVYTLLMMQSEMNR